VTKYTKHVGRRKSRVKQKPNKIRTETEQKPNKKKQTMYYGKKRDKTREKALISK